MSVYSLHTHDFHKFNWFAFCFRFILSVRSPVFKKLLSAQTSAELLREPIDASTDAVKTMVKYLYTDTLDNQDINEDLMNLADKYELTQMKELCLPSFVKKIKAENCLKAYIYGYLHNYEPLKFAAFHMLDENWKNYENSSDLIGKLKNINRFWMANLYTTKIEWPSKSRIPLNHWGQYAKIM